MIYYDKFSEEVEITADRIVYCESGITIAALLDVLNMEGDVEFAKSYTRRGKCHLSDGMVGLRQDTTLRREIEDLQERSDDELGCWMGKITLDWNESFISFPGEVFRKRRARSDVSYVRSGENFLSCRGYQMAAKEEVLHA